MSPSIERIAGQLTLRPLRPPDDGRRRAAVAAVLEDEPAGARVLLMKRLARAGDPWSGHISLPGGRYHPDDRDLLATAIRETREELGVELSATRVLGNLPALSPLTAGPAGIEVTPFVFLSDAPLAPQVSAEAEAAFWLPIEQAAAGTLDDTYIYAGTDRPFPSWRFGEHVIWGLTFRILQDLLALAR